MQHSLQTFIVAKSEKLAAADQFSKQPQYLGVSCLWAPWRIRNQKPRTTEVHPYTSNRLPGGNFWCSWDAEMNFTNDWIAFYCQSKHVHDVA